MKNIRQNIFETNSSSSHSLSIPENTRGVFDTIDCDTGGVIHITGGYFGRQWDAYNDALAKINYCATDQKNNENNLKMLEEIIKEQTCCSAVIFHMNEEDRGYTVSAIDHQSMGTSTELFADKEKLRNFLFNTDCSIIIGSDETLEPPNIFEFGEHIQYKYVLKINGIKLTYKFEDFPKRAKLLEAIECLIGNAKNIPRDYRLFLYSQSIRDANKKTITSTSKLKNNIIVLHKPIYDLASCQIQETKEKELKFSIRKIKNK